MFGFTLANCNFSSACPLNLVHVDPWFLLIATQNTSLRVDLSSRADWFLFSAECLLSSLTLVAVIFAGLAAKASTRTANAADRAIKQEQLFGFRNEFEERGYFMRFWRLDLLTRDPLSVPFGATRIEIDRNGHHTNGEIIGPAGLDEPVLQRKANDLKSRLDAGNTRDVLYDAIGPGFSNDRADLVAVYWYALKLHWYLQSGLGNDLNARADELTQGVGYQLLVTLIRHRMFAARLKPLVGSGRSEDYFGQAYGLNDSRYAELTESLFEAAARQNSLPEQDMKELWNREKAVASYGYIGADLVRSWEKIVGGDL